MRLLTRLMPLFCLCACNISGPASGPALSLRNGPLDGYYGEPDAGYLVTALTAVRGGGYTSYALRFRKNDRSADSEIWWGANDDFDDWRHPEIKDDIKTGIVDVRPLPPGTYELFNFEMVWAVTSGGGGVFFTSRRADVAGQDFSIPFTIRPGQTTYVGEFMAVVTHGSSLIGYSIPKGAYLLLTDQATRDGALARAKQPRVRDIQDATIDPERAGIPLVRGDFLPQQ